MPQKKVKINIISPERVLRAKKGEILSEVLRLNGLIINSYCGGRGICGKCLVKIVKGRRPAPKNAEKELIKENQISSGFRLACLYRLESDISLRISKEYLAGPINILDQGLSTPLSPLPRVKKFALSSPVVTVEEPLSLVEALEHRLGRRLSLTLGAAKLIPSALRRAGRGRITVAILDGREILDVEAGDNSKNVLGAAVDIGTSTVALELLDLASGRSVGRTAAINAQTKFGFDIISRLAAAVVNPDNLARMSAVIRDQIDGQILDLCRKLELSPRSLYEIVVAGNSVMNHIFLGVPISTLAMSPFCSVFGSAPETRASDVGLKAANPEARVYTAPNVKSFIGGDIAAGLAVLDFANLDGNFLFIDLGTNGEIVLKKGSRTTATSTAAGPAFEGMTLSCGMPALPGAICSARWENGFSIKTVQDGPVRGVCGTGLIDVLALGLKRGFISPDGRISGRAKSIKIKGQISLTQEDIRKMQLAIAAFKSGIRMILKSMGLRAIALDKIFVGGAFGSSLNIRNAMAIGLLPTVAKEKVVFIGNSSLAGARKLLLSSPERRKIESFVRKIRHLSLAGDKTFESQFVKALEIKSYSEETS